MGLAELGAVAGGLNQGYDLAQKDQELKDQRAFRVEDRAFKKLQQDDLLAKQKREAENAERDDQYAKNYDSAGNLVSEVNPDTGETTTRYPSETERLALIRNAQVKARKFGEAEQTQSALRKIFTDVDRQNYNTLLQSSSSMDMPQLAAAVQKMVTADGSPLTVDTPKTNADGSYTFNVRNKWNGTAMPFTAKTKEDLLRGLQFHMDYDNYAANQAAARAEQLKRADGVKLAAGDVHYDYDASGKLVLTATNDNEPSAVQAARIRAEALAGAGGKPNAGDAGAGANAKSDKAADPSKAISDALDFVKGSLKDSPPDVVAKVQQYAHQVVTNSGGKIPPQLAASIAIDVANNPAKLQPRVDRSTGHINQVYESPETGEVLFQRGYASAQQPNGLTTDQFKSFANDLVAAQPAEIKPKFVAAAFDKTGVARRDLESGVKSEINAIYDARVAANPAAKAGIDAERAAVTKSSMESLGRKLDLVSAHYPPPKPASAAAPAGAPRPPPAIPAVGGIYQRPTLKDRQTRLTEAKAKIADDKSAAMKDAAQKASAALAANDIVAAAKVQASSEFGDLDEATKMKIYKLVNGIK